MALIGTLMVEMAANVARLEADLKVAIGHVKSTENMISSSINTMNGLFGALGITLGAASFVGFVKSSIDAQEELSNLSEQTGTNIRDLAGLKFAADQNGASLEMVAQAGRKLGNAMVDKPALFAKFGVTAKDSSGALVQLADVFKNMPAGIEKSALATQIFGKSGAEMIPFLNEGSASLANLILRGKELNPVTEESARQAKLFNDRMDEMKASGSGLGITLANTMLPSLNNTAEAMNRLIKEGHSFQALVRGLAGSGQMFWDFLIPPENVRAALSADGMIADAEKKIKALKIQLASGGAGSWNAVDEEAINQEILVLNNHIATIKKHRAELDKPATLPVVAQDTGRGNALLTALGAGGAAEDAAADKAAEKRRAATAKMMADDDAQAKKEADHTAQMMNTQQAKFAMLAQLAEDAEATEVQRAQLRVGRQLAELEQQRFIMSNDHQLSVAELAAFEQAKIDILTASQAPLFAEGARMDEYAREQEDYARRLEAARVYQQASGQNINIASRTQEIIKADHEAKLVALGKQGALSREQFAKLSAGSQVQIASGMMQNLIGGASQHSRAMFNIMKAAKLAEAAVALPDTVMKAYAAGASVGGPFALITGAAFAATAFAAQMIQMNAIKSASFGGGGGGAAPSGGGASSISIPGQTAAPNIISDAAMSTPTEPRALPSAGVAAAPPKTFNFYFTSGTHLVDMDKFVRDAVIPAFNEAVGDSVVINAYGN